MATLNYDEKFYSREIPFCKVYSLDSKKQLEKLFLKNRISYFVDWQEQSFLQRIFSSSEKKEKNVFIIRINEGDIERARDLIQGITSVKMNKTVAEK